MTAGGGAATSGVLHVVAPAPFGGLESVVQALTVASLRAGHPVTVVALLQDEAPHPFVERLRLDGVTVAEVRCGRRRYVAEARALTSVIRRTGASLIHTHNYHADIVGLLAARWCRVPIVTTVHGFSGGDRKNRAYEWLDRRLLRFFDGVICVSEDIRSRAVRAGCRPGRIALVPNGFAPRAFAERAEARSLLGLDDADRVVGWVGRLSHAKGPDLLVEAVAGLDVPDVRVVVIGDGDERDRMVARRAALGIPPARLRLLGARDDAARLLPAFDVLALSSRSEGTPMVLLEGIAAGVPVVSFAVGGIPDVLNEAAGWLVKPGDVSALGAAMRDALQRPDEAERRAGRARKILEERFGLERWVEQVQTVYARVAPMNA